MFKQVYWNLTLLLFIVLANEWFAFSEELFLFMTFGIFFLTLYNSSYSFINNLLTTSIQSLKASFLTFYYSQERILYYLIATFENFENLNLFFASTLNQFRTQFNFFDASYAKHYIFGSNELLIQDFDLDVEDEGELTQPNPQQTDFVSDSNTDDGLAAVPMNLNLEYGEEINSGDYLNNLFETDEVDLADVISDSLYFENDLFFFLHLNTLNIGVTDWLFKQEIHKILLTTTLSQAFATAVYFDSKVVYTLGVEEDEQEQTSEDVGSD